MNQALSKAKLEKGRKESDTGEENQLKEYIKSIE